MVRKMALPQPILPHLCSPRRYYRLDELARQCEDAYKRLDTVKVVQLLNGQKNLSGMDMRKLDISKIDFRGASL